MRRPRQPAAPPGRGLRLPVPRAGHSVLHWTPVRPALDVPTAGSTTATEPVCNCPHFTGYDAQATASSRRVCGGPWVSPTRPSDTPLDTSARSVAHHSACPNFVAVDRRAPLGSWCCARPRLRAAERTALDEQRCEIAPRGEALDRLQRDVRSCHSSSQRRPPGEAGGRRWTSLLLSLSPASPGSASRVAGRDPRARGRRGAARARRRSAWRRSRARRPRRAPAAPRLQRRAGRT